MPAQKVAMWDLLPSLSRLTASIQIAIRVKVTNQGLTVQGIAGTYVVLLGFDIDEADCGGLMGFVLHRTHHTEDEAYWLEG